MSTGRVKGKVAIVGAGDVGATTAYSLMSSGAVSEIALIDIDQEKVEGEAMDLSHGTGFVKPVDVYAGTYEDCWDADVVVITAGASQKPGESRLELLERNVSIFEDMVPKITERISPETVLLVVTNPVDVLSYVTWQVSDLPYERVIGSGTALDTARFKQVISEHCDVATKNVHAYVIGEHGDSEVPLWSSAHLAGIPFDEYCELTNRPHGQEVKDDIAEEVRGAAYEIIEKKGATYYAIGMATTDIIEGLIRDEDTIMTVSTLMQGQYGLEDLYLSLPCVVNRRGIRQVLELDLSEDEREAFIESANVLEDTIEELGL
ncbi:L-lactate dehydrogenase [Halapricum sp. CBA1109]|uniref:L-lactate dehydrogenase n=1 Tax=Halapricum sp. CBA1109 TaxID=2668068 RepID=UPI0012FB0C1C|nr:L-lactate dehydrogenase [Halapricum sp. CBA1109]MUV90218.1 L-lactate dehydrogenase [Halapricum sp. CBA1109]